MTAMTLWENQKSAKPLLRKWELSLHCQILPGRVLPRHSHAPDWDWDPKTEGLSPHPWQSPWGVPRKPQEDSAHSEGSVSRPYSLGGGLQGHNPQHPPSPPDLRLLGAPPAETLPILGGLPREALGMWLLNEVTSPKWRPEGQRGLCFSQHQHTGDPHMQKRGSTHHPTGWALQETTEDLFRKARGSGQGWLAPTPGQDLQVRHKTRKMDTLLHQHP